MGGGEGSTARELLRHKTVEKVVMCDIDEEVVDFCKSYLDVNKEAFCNPRLDLSSMMLRLSFRIERIAF
ncbi:thermospermine synthase [Ranunculus cassubicifolius]